MNAIHITEWCPEGKIPDTHTTYQTHSPFFHAPEMLESRLYDPFAADIWSIGCVILEVCHLYEHHNFIWSTAQYFHTHKIF